MSILRLIKTLADTINLNGDSALRVVVTTAAAGDLTGPTNIGLSNDSIVSGSVIGSVVGSLTTVNGEAPFTYTITNDPDNKFDISGSNLITDATVDFPTDPSHEVTIMVTDVNLNTFSKAFVISVTEAPTYANEFSMTFNGVDERIETDFSFGGRTAFTLNSYMYRSSTTERLDISQTNAGNNIRVKLIRNSNGTIIAVIDGTTSSYANNTTGWLMLTMTFDGSQAVGSRVRMYIDGILTASVAPTSFGASVDANSEKCYIGYDLGSSRFSTGNIDETSMWNIPLDPAQVTELYNSGVPLDLTTHSEFAEVISWWRLGEELASPNMPDQVGSNDGTLSNMDATNRSVNLP